MASQQWRWLPNANSNGYRDANSYADSNGYRDANTNSDNNANTNGYSDANANTYGYSDTDADGNADQADADAKAASDAVAPPDAVTGT